ncbi:hypothetical protein [Dasania marina]|uniref:hypothetical protein n=1 Tax=Dasania marina TaxID=471499 RepID=UPI0003703B5A|nr:hypothetical protein [Dasania marina]
MRIAITIIILSFITGCASITKESRWIDAGDNPAQLLVYRDAGGHSKAMAANFGSSQHYIVDIMEKEFIDILLPPGEEIFKTAGDGSTGGTFKITLSPNTKTCLKIEPNPAQWAAVAIPILLAVIPAYNVNEVECPSEDYLASFKRLSIEL